MFIYVKSILHGGEGEIRTLDTLAGILLFESSALNHSATSPRRNRHASFRKHIFVTYFQLQVASSSQFYKDLPCTTLQNCNKNRGNYTL